MKYLHVHTSHITALLLLIIHTTIAHLTNEEADSVAYAIEERRASTTARTAERRATEYVQRCAQYETNALQARAVFMSTSDPNANITVWEFMFRDPTLSTDVNANNFRTRMGDDPYPFVHITFNNPHDFQTNRRGGNGDGKRSLKPNQSLTSTTIRSILHLTDGTQFNTDNKTWASISLVRGFSFFGRKYRHYYPLKTGEVGYVCFIFKTNPQHIHYQQCICTSPVNGVAMVAPVVQMLSGCACPKKGPFVEPDLVARFTCTDDSEDPTTFTWRIISVRRGPKQPLEVVDLDLRDASLKANIWGVYREVIELSDSP